MRFAAYAGTSMVLATGVIVKALHSRANFYSACVYLSQSNACLMILSNLLLLVVGSMLLGLQRLLYGPLRPIEIEQLYEKAWFAVTETCLAMTIFRDEVGAWFVVMFISLLVGKVWGWIGEGRIEILEQQPPANPRLFHARLATSLAASLSFDAYLLKYAILTVQQQARPNMMVMFAFEFAVLTVNSMSICLRYAILLWEAAIIHEQTKKRMQELREQIIREREEAARNAAEAGQQLPEDVPIEELLDEADIDYPGWEEKSRWVFYLDLATDFVKLFLYLTFFCVLCMFYGMPIHIIRDVALTIRSFYKRLTDFLKYRHATRDMNDRYPDATAEDIRSQDVCIICREPMRAWSPHERNEGDGAPATPQVDQHLRPKKLPCSHILHFACLRSWLERQQNCPTCRQPVLSSSSSSTTSPAAQGQAQQAAANRNGPDGRQEPGDQNRIRFFNLGPLRLGFGAGNDLRALEQQLENEDAPAANRPAANDRDDGNVHQFGFSLGMRRNRRAPPSDGQSSSRDIQSQLQSVEQQLMRQAYSLNLQHEQLQLIRSMQGELARLRIANANPPAGHSHPYMNYNHMPPNLQLSPQSLHQSQTVVSALTADSTQQTLRSGDRNIPPGVVIPEGWSLLPLRPLNELNYGLPTNWNSIPHPFNGSTSPPAPQVTASNTSAIAQPTVRANLATPTNRSEDISSADNGSNTPHSTVTHQPDTARSSAQETRGSAAPPQWSSGLMADSSTSRNGATTSQQGPALSTEGNQEGNDREDRGKGKPPTVEDTEDREANP